MVRMQFLEYGAYDSGHHNVSVSLEPEEVYWTVGGTHPKGMLPPS
jgi:hypothetical protein